MKTTKADTAEPQRSDEAFKAFTNELVRLKIGGGLHTDRERKMLWHCAERTREGAIVEIGSFEGASSVLLAMACGAHTEVITIDPHVGKLNETDEEESSFVGDTWPVLNRNLHQAGVTNKVQSLRLTSEEAASGWEAPIGLLFVDGSHRYEDVRKDILLWKPHLLPGSTIVFHDLWVKGVRNSVAEHVLADKTFGNLKYAPCCMYTATFYGIDCHGRGNMQKALWRLILKLRGTIESATTLRRWLNTVIRRVSQIRA